MENVNSSLIQNSYNEYDNYYNELVAVLCDVIENKEYTDEHKKSIDTLNEKYNDAYLDIKQQLEHSEEIIVDNKLEVLGSALLPNTQDAVFNALTNGGKVQGLFKDEDGGIHLNAKFLQTRGLEVLNDDGVQTLFIDDEGNLTTSGDIVGGTITGTKLQALTIDTNEVDIASKDGSMVIKGTMQQFKDENGVVRIHIGKDDAGNFVFKLFGTNGQTVLIDQNGIKADAIGTNTIKSEHIETNSITANHIKTDVFDSINANIENLTSDKATIKDLEVANGTINNLKSEVADINKLTTQELNAVKGNIQELQADVIEVNELVGTKATIKDLEVTNANVDTLNTNVANINQAVINKADISELNAVKGNISSLQSDVAKIGVLEGDVANIEHILSGNITSEHIQTGTITAGSGIISDGAIGSAQISELDAGKISAGTIDTSKVSVAGANGHLQIKGNRLQVFDGTGSNAVERVSLGDVDNNGTVFGLRVRGKDGKTVLLDENGVTNQGITNGSITNEKINGNANISGDKLDINSVVRSVNGATEKITGTVIQVGDASLDVKLSEINNTQTSTLNKVNSNTASIKANTDAIKLKVDSQTYTTDKTAMTTTLEKHTGEISAMKDSIALKVEKTDITKAIEDNNKTVDNKINTAKAEIKVTTDAITQNVSNLSKTVDTKADGSTVSKVSDRVSTVETGLNGISQRVSATETSTSDLSKSLSTLQGTVSATSNKVSTLETNLGSITQRVSATETSTSNLTKDLNTTKTNLTNVTNRVSNAESKLTKDSLTTTIGSHYTTSNDVNGIVTSKGYQTQSQVQQTVDALQLKFTQSGGYNLLLNSSGLGGTSHWVNGASSFDGYVDTNIKEQTSCGNAFRVGNNATGEKFVHSHRFLLQKGKSYTISGKYYVGSGNKGIDVYLLTSNTIDGTGNNQVTVYDNAYSCVTSSTYDGKWKSFSKTVTVGTSVKSGVIRLGNNGSDTNGTIKYSYFADLIIEEGEISSPWSPHPSEVYGGVTTIDKDGITVTASSVKSKTNMSADGFKITKTDTNEDVFKVNSDGTLAIKGNITVTSGTVPSSTLSGTISDNNISTTIKNGASAGTSAKSQVDAWKYTGTTEINGGNIRTGTLDAGKITTGTLDASKVTVTNINAGNITSGTISADRLDANTIVSKVNGATTTISGDKITTGTLSASKITSGTLDASKVTVSNLNASNITSGTINASLISADTLKGKTITGGTVSGGTVSGATITGSTIKNSNNTFNINSSGVITSTSSSDANVSAKISNGELTLNGKYDTGVSSGYVTTKISNGNVTIGKTLYGDGYINSDLGLIEVDCNFLFHEGAESSLFQSKKYKILGNNGNYYNAIQVTDDNYLRYGGSAYPLELYATETPYVNIDGTRGKILNSSENIKINKDTAKFQNSTTSVELNTQTSNSYFRPSTTDGSLRLGSSSYKWNSLWSVSTTINSSSDRRFKKEITPIDEKLEGLFMDLKPCNYRLRKNDDGRRHNGFIAQEVEDAMKKHDIPYEDFAGLTKFLPEEGVEPVFLTRSGEVDYEYGLGYGEFTALNVHMIQKLYKIVEEQEKRITELENEIKTLKECS